MELCEVPLELLRRTVVEVISQPDVGPINVTGGDLAGYCGQLPNSGLWAACRIGTEGGRPFATCAIFDDEQSARSWSPAEHDQLASVRVASHRRQPDSPFAELVLSEKLLLGDEGHVLPVVSKFLQDIIDIANSHGLVQELLGAPHVVGRAA